MQPYKGLNPQPSLISGPLSFPSSKCCYHLFQGKGWIAELWEEETGRGRLGMRGGDVAPRTCRAAGGGARHPEGFGRGCLGRGFPQKARAQGERATPSPARAPSSGEGGAWRQRAWLRRPRSQEEDWPNTRSPSGDPRAPERQLPRPELISSREKVVGTLSGRQGLATLRKWWQANSRRAL